MAPSPDQRVHSWQTKSSVCAMSDPPGRLLLHIAGEQRAEHEGVRAEPDQLPLHVPAVRVRGSEKRLHPGVLGDCGKGVGQEGADGIGDAMEILVRPARWSDCR